MDDRFDAVPAKLRLISTIVITLAAAKVVFPLLNRFTGIGVSFRWLTTTGPVILIPPAVWLVAALQLRRGRYGAALTLIVFSAGLLLMAVGDLVPRPAWMLRYPLWFVSSVLVPGGVLAMGIWAGRHTAYSDVDTLRAVRRRAGVALGVTAGVIGLLAGAIILLMALAFKTPLRGNEQLAVIIGSGIVIVSVVAAILFASRVPALRRGDRPGVGGIIFAGIVAAFILFVAWVLRGLVWNLSVQVALGLTTWLMVDLIHARRTAEEPLSYGFEPILQPPTVR